MTLEDPLVLRSDRVDGLTTVTISRPGQFNSLANDMLTAIKGELDASEDVRVVATAAANRCR